MIGSLDKVLVTCLVDLLFGLEEADEDEVDSDFSVKMMESVGAELQDMGKEDMDNFVDIVNEMALKERDEVRKEYLECFIDNFGLSDLDL